MARRAEARPDLGDVLLDDLDRRSEHGHHRPALRAAAALFLYRHPRPEADDPQVTRAPYDVEAIDPGRTTSALVRPSGFGRESKASSCRIQPQGEADLTRTIPKVWALVTGNVPDIGPQTDGLVEPTQGMLGRYSLDFRPALRTRHYEPFDEAGIPVRTWSAVAGYAIACFQRLGDTGDPLWERRFLAQARYLVSKAEPSPAGGMGWRGGPPRAAFEQSSLKAGWMSALYQGQAMSVLVRAHLLTKEPAFLDAANEAWPMLLVPVARGGLAATFLSTTDDCWEELPTTPPSRILNGWILAIWGLLDLAAVTPSTRVQDVSTSALESLRRHLQEYDTGWWSTYDHPDGKPPRLASVSYHYAHIWMLRALAARTGVDDFALWATRWDRDAHTATHRLRALVGKAGQRLAHGY